MYHYLKFFIGLYFCSISWTIAAAPQHILSKLHLLPGFRIQLFADNVPNARTLAVGDNGTIYVGTRQEGSIYALQDTNRDGISDKRYLLGEHLNMPNGVAYLNGDLYVAEINRINRFANISTQLEHPPKPSVVYADLPADIHHGWKVLRVGPDRKLYSAVGAPCNVCNLDKPFYGTLFRLNPDGSDFEILATGIRNSVGFDWHPLTKTLFFTDNGRDYLGDDAPADELNRWSSKGQHFGFPYCHGGTTLDPDFGKVQSCNDFTPPVWQFKAHMAPLGIRFYTGKQFPAQYQNQLFVAQHGSWNRSQAHGYRVVTMNFKGGKPTGESVFIDGWLTEQGEVLGRPTDILQLPDGSLLITDDTLGVIYRVTYQGQL